MTTTRPNSTVCATALSAPTTPGLLSIGSNNIIHPGVTFISSHPTSPSPIIIGSDNIIEEGVVIRNASNRPLVIGSGNHFRIGVLFEGTRLGNNNLIEPKAHITPSTSLGNNIIITAGVSTIPNQVISDGSIYMQNNTIIQRKQHGESSNESSFEEMLRAQAREMKESLHTRHIEYLHEILPKYHQLMKT